MSSERLAAFMRDVQAESLRRKRASWRRTRMLLALGLLAAWAMAAGVGAMVQ